LEWRVHWSHFLMSPSNLFSDAIGTCWLQILQSIIAKSPNIIHNALYCDAINECVLAERTAILHKRVNKFQQMLHAKDSSLSPCLPLRLLTIGNEVLCPMGASRAASAASWGADFQIGFYPAACDCAVCILSQIYCNYEQPI
jgi:hypothetical protein